MSNININSSFQNFSDFVSIYLFIVFSLSFTTNGSVMHATCGTDIELTCPISLTKRSNEVISWFRPNSSQTQLTFIAIGDILFPEYASIGRFNLISSSSSSASRLSISNVLIEDQGIYVCKSSSSGQHSIKLLVNSHPYISPSSPLFLYPVNRTFSITCSVPCNSNLNPNNLYWLVNGELLDDDKHDFSRHMTSSNTQQLTVYLDRKHKDFTQANYTCRYDENEATILVRRRTKEEIYRLPRQRSSSIQYLFQTVFDKGLISCQSSFLTVFFSFLFLLCFY